MLELFYLKECPFCKKVMESFLEHDIYYVKKDISVKENYDKLMQIGKKEQVPFLIDTDLDKCMYESDEIIKYALASKNR